MSTLTPESPPAAPAPPPTPARRGRIGGIDLARSLALLGMVAVHVSIADYVADDGSGAPGWLGYLFGLAGGRASVLFFVLAGISATIVARSLPREQWNGAFWRRGALLVVGGALFTHYWWPASILQNYGLVFLLAPLLLRFRTRALVALAATSFLVGPLLAQLGWPTEPPDGLLGDWAYTGLVEPLNGGIYPLTVWVCFFLVGLALGRLDLGDPRLARRLAVASMAGLLALIPLLGALDTARADTAAGWMDEAVAEDGYVDTDTGPGINPWQLTLHHEHADTPAWMAEGLLMAGLVLGLCLLVAGARPLRPLLALGTVSLSAYVLHGFAIGVVAERWYPDLLLGTWTRALAFLLALQAGLVALAWLHRRRYRRGPLEWATHRVARLGGVGGSE